MPCVWLSSNKYLLGMMPLNFLFPKPVIQNVISADTSHGWTLRDIAYSGQSCSELCQNRSEFSWKGTQTKLVFSAASGLWFRLSHFCKQKHPWADLNVRQPFIPTLPTKTSPLNYKSLQVFQHLNLFLPSIFTGRTLWAVMLWIGSGNWCVFL